MNHDSATPAYGLWTLVLLNSAVFILFALSFFKPQTRRDWRTFGSFSGFIIQCAAVTRRVTRDALGQMRGTSAAVTADSL
jgi:hypothetical protein